MQKTCTIALDGPAGSGKTTVGVAVSHLLGFLFLDSGLVYRLVTLASIQDGILKEDQVDSAQLKCLLQRINLKITFQNRQNHYFLNQKEVFILDLNDAALTSQIKHLASNLGVRQFVNQFCRRLAQQHEGVIITGRDAATNIIPQANLKFFLTASLKDRAERRYKEKMANHEKTTYDKVFQDLQRRDLEDYHRKIGRLHFNNNYHLIDSSHLGFQATVDIFVNIIKEYQNE